MSPTRLIKTPERDSNGLFIQPKEVGPEREIIEQHHRDFLAGHFKYADETTGVARTFDPTGNYNCGACNQADNDKCLLVNLTKIDRDAGSCGQWENLCAGDTEMKTQYMNATTSVYGVAENGKGFGCHRCPFASKAYEPDSRGRNLYCGKADTRVSENACCSLNGAKCWPMDDKGNVTKDKKLTTEQRNTVFTFSGRTKRFGKK